jgi:hypothetical protein
MLFAAAGLVVIATVGIAVALLASSPPSTGFVSGRFQAVGGPVSRTPTPLRGTVTVRGSSGKTYNTIVRADGQFLIQVPVGVYGVTGRSPQYMGGQSMCLNVPLIKVNPNAATNVDVNCQEM